MALDGREVRRVDVGDGVYVTVPATTQPPRHVPTPALLLGAGLSGIGLARLGITAEGLLAAGLLPVLVALAAIDIRARVLPNRIIGPAMVAVLVWQLAFARGDIAGHLLAAFGAGAFLLLPGLLKPGSMGMGDVKLAALLGLALGSQVVSALTIGCLAAAPAAAGVLVAGGSRARQSFLPFGPFLGLGAAVVLLAG
jgi:prepilin signal peptidase PulO-like enzyme (type II secretory pathway)